MNNSDFDDFLAELTYLWRPNDPVKLSDWAEERITLDSGPLVLRPYQRKILDSMLDNEFTFCLKSARVGYTQLLTIALLYYSVPEGNPSRQLLVFPTITDCDGFSKTELQTICTDNNQTVFTSDTVRTKIYPGGILYLIGSQSEASFRRISVDNCFIDELSAIQSRANVMGDVYSLALKRAESSHNRRVIVGSTPGSKDNCRMTELYETGTRELFHAPCLECKTHHPLLWDQFLHLNDDQEPTHECPHCGYEMRHFQKFTWMEQGDADWVAQSPTATRTSLFVWSAYSYDKNCQWEDLKTEYRLALNSETLMNVFQNTFLGRTYEESYDQIDWKEFVGSRLDTRTAPGFVPDDVIVTYGGIDVQKDRFEATIIGYNAAGKWHLIDHITIETDGDVYDPSSWVYLSDFIGKPIYSEDGKTSQVVRKWALDSGFATSMCYDFAKDHPKVIPIKGSSMITRDIETTPRRIQYSPRKSIKLYMIGGHKLKKQTIGEINNPKLCSFPTMENGYFQQLFSEKLVTVKGVEKYIKTQKENEAFDCLLYALFVANVDKVKLRVKKGKK